MLIRVVNTSERDNVVLVCYFDVAPNSRLSVITTWLVSTVIRCAFLDGFALCEISVAEMSVAQMLNLVNCENLSCMTEVNVLSGGYLTQHL
jgi:hypothetical protein